MSNTKRTAGVRSEIGRAFSLSATAGLAGLMGLGLGTAATAADAPSTAATEVEGLVVQATARESNPKETAAPINQSQTTTVIDSAALQAQNLLSLRDILMTVPGITFGAAEGGTQPGDIVNIRGFSGTSDIQTDGVRDSGQYSRSDSFNLEQVEIVNGPDSVTSGGGSIGGTINLVSKQPGALDFTRVTGGLGSHSYARATVDANKLLTDSIAVRLNAMRHKGDAPGRDVETSDRWAIAPSIKFGVGADTSFTIDYLRQHDDSIPQYGIPIANGQPLPGVNWEGYYGSAGGDRQTIDRESYSGTFSHNGANGLSFRNFTRWQEVSQLSVASPPQGTFCLSNGFQPAAYSQSATSTGPGAPVTFTSNTTGFGTTACSTPGVYSPGGPRGITQQSVNKILYNQGDVTWRGATGSAQHVLNIGYSLSEESYHRDSGNSFRNAGGATPNPTFNPINIANPTPDAVYTGPINFIRTSASDGEVRNKAIYAFDTITLNPQWLVNLGGRYEENEGTAMTSAVSLSGVVTPSAPTGGSDSIFSYRAGLVYKPSANSSLYLAYGNSKTPSQSSVNGSCNASTCNVEPETAYNYEVGAKWRYRGLFLSAALFRNDRANYKVNDPGNPDNPSGFQVTEGHSRVEGLALSASGAITPAWSFSGNYTYLRSKVIQGISDYQTSIGALDPTKGDRLTNTPEHAFSLFTSYRVTPEFEIGYGLSYQGEMYLNQHSALTVTCAPTACPGRQVRSTLPLVKVEGYTVSRLMASYQLPQGVGLQLNVQNLFDEDYLTGYGNAGIRWAQPGAARSATITASYSF